MKYGEVYLAKIKINNDWSEAGVLKIYLMPIPGGEAYSFKNSCCNLVIHNLDNVHIIKQLKER